MRTLDCDYDTSFISVYIYIYISATLVGESGATADMTVWCGAVLKAYSVDQFDLISQRVCMWVYVCYCSDEIFLFGWVVARLRIVLLARLCSNEMCATPFTARWMTHVPYNLCDNVLPPAAPNY